MTHQAPPSPVPAGADPGRQVAQLREVLRLVGTLSGETGGGPADSTLDAAARVSAAYDRAPPIVQRRFDALAAEAAAWAAAGVEALVAPGDRPVARAAAARLARRIERALDELAGLLPQAG
jgi:hypothetical protein